MVSLQTFFICWFILCAVAAAADAGILSTGKRIEKTFGLTVANTIAWLIFALAAYLWW